MAKEHPTIHPPRLKKLLKRMIDIYSPSGKEEQVITFLAAYLKKHRIAATRQAVGDIRQNLLALPENPEAVEMVFIGHVDTVMAYDLEAFHFEEKGGRIRGLGAADMKGGCAAMVEAFVAFTEHGGAPLPAALALVVGEEEEGDGACRLLEEFHFPWAVIGEPTELRPCLGHFGYMEIQLRTFGKRKHASLASKRENAVEAMLQSLLTLSHYLDQTHPDIVCNIRDLQSAHAGFAVPDRCEAWLDLHLPPNTAIGGIATDLEDVFNCRCREYEAICGQFRLTTIDTGYDLPDKGPLIQRLQDIYTRRGLAWSPDIFRSHSDANQLWAAGIKPIIIGPGRLEEAHTPEESIAFSEVVRGASLYLDLLVDLSRHRNVS